MNEPPPHLYRKTNSITQSRIFSVTFNGQRFCALPSSAATRIGLLSRSTRKRTCQRNRGYVTCWPVRFPRIVSEVSLISRTLWIVVTPPPPVIPSEAGRRFSFPVRSCEPVGLRREESQDAVSTANLYAQGSTSDLVPLVLLEISSIAY